MFKIGNIYFISAIAVIGTSVLCTHFLLESGSRF